MNLTLQLVLPPLPEGKSNEIEYNEPSYNKEDERIKNLMKLWKPYSEEYEKSKTIKNVMADSQFVMMDSQSSPLKIKEKETIKTVVGKRHECKSMEEVNQKTNKQISKNKRKPSETSDNDLSKHANEKKNEAVPWTMSKEMENAFQDTCLIQAKNLQLSQRKDKTLCNIYNDLGLRWNFPRMKKLEAEDRFNELIESGKAKMIDGVYRYSLDEAAKRKFNRELDAALPR